MPNARVFCLPPNLYARRQSLLPCVGTRRCKPPPSESLNGLARGLKLRTAVSLRGMLVSSLSHSRDTNYYTNIFGEIPDEGGQSRSDSAGKRRCFLLLLN